MAVPGGTASFGDINATMGRGYSWQVDMGFFRSNTKDGVGDMNSYRNREWYQKNNSSANCYNGHCNCWGNCGELQCYQCWPSQCVNCGNCDGRPWLQYNCNCACQFQCIPNLASYNCNCACYCDCGNTCFLPGTEVLMANGTYKKIEEIKVSDQVIGIDKKINNVIGLWRPLLGKRKMFSVNNGDVITTGDHMIHTENGWAVIEKSEYNNRKGQPVKLIDGPIVNLSGVDAVDVLTVGTKLKLHDNNLKSVTNIDELSMPADTQLYTLATDGNYSFSLKSGVVVDGIPQ